MKVPKLTIPEYRKKYIQLVEDNMKMQRIIESQKKTIAEENRRRQIAVAQLIAEREWQGS